MLNCTAIFLSGILVSALAIAADGQGMRVTASNIQVDETSMTTTLMGQVRVTLPPGAVITIAADTMSPNQAAEEAHFEGHVRLTVRGAELTANGAIVKRGSDGATEVSSEEMRIVRVANQ